MVDEAMRIRSDHRPLVFEADAFQGQRVYFERRPPTLRGWQPKDREEMQRVGRELEAQIEGAQTCAAVQQAFAAVAETLD
eukprot:9410255-Lingulodinium_polyedra.AAC.1